MSDLVVGDPVWIDQLSAKMEPTGEPFTYTGPGVVWEDCRPRALLVQIATEVILWVPNPWNVVPYRRPLCQYCESLGMIAEDRAGEGVRWTCADCMGGQDT